MAEQEVADQHTRFVAPQHPRRKLAAAHTAFVDHIIVKERRRVHELDSRGKLDVPVTRVAAEAGGGQGQHRPQALAA